MITENVHKVRKTIAKNGGEKCPPSKLVRELVKQGHTKDEAFKMIFESMDCSGGFVELKKMSAPRSRFFERNGLTNPRMFDTKY